MNHASHDSERSGTEHPGTEHSGAEQPVPEGARPVHPDGEIDAPTTGEAAAVTEPTGSPAEGTGAAPGEEPPISVRESPTEGLGASATGDGAHVHEADSPAEGLGAARGDGTDVREAESPRHGTGAP